jgi:hypothetical protein
MGKTEDSTNAMAKRAARLCGVSAQCMVQSYVLRSHRRGASITARRASGIKLAS